MLVRHHISLVFMGLMKTFYCLGSPIIQRGFSKVCIRPSPPTPPWPATGAGCAAASAARSGAHRRASRGPSRKRRWRFCRWKVGWGWDFMVVSWWFHGDFMVIWWWFHGDFMVISMDISPSPTWVCLKLGCDISQMAIWTWKMMTNERIFGSSIFRQIHIEDLDFLLKWNIIGCEILRLRYSTRYCFFGY